MEQIINEDTPLYSISSAARILGISVHTLRMYEKEGLFLPHKTESGHRLFSNRDIERLKCIRNAINEMKFSIAAIRNIYSLIPCWDIVKCPDSERNNCIAYNNYGKPCWSYDHKTNICKNLNCRKCEVYVNYSDCHKIRDSIKNIRKS